MEIKIIDYEGERIETGPIQLGKSDWPGIFIRGDNAFAFHMDLVSLIIGNANGFQVANIRCLMDLLEQCDLNMKHTKETRGQAKVADSSND